MSCQSQVTNYFRQKYLVQQALENHESTQDLIKRLEATEYADYQLMMTCVNSQPIVYPAFPLGGTWKYGGKPGPVFQCHGVLMTIDMSAYTGLPGTDVKKRATAGGCILTGSTIWVYFPDDKAYTGTLHAPNRIVWSNGSEWDKA